MMTSPNVTSRWQNTNFGKGNGIWFLLEYLLCGIKVRDKTYPLKDSYFTNLLYLMLYIMYILKTHFYWIKSSLTLGFSQPNRDLLELLPTVQENIISYKCTYVTPSKSSANMFYLLWSSILRVHFCAYFSRFLWRKNNKILKFYFGVKLIIFWAYVPFVLLPWGILGLEPN
jgi:hypothetical protein